MNRGNDRAENEADAIARYVLGGGAMPNLRTFDYDAARQAYMAFGRNYVFADDPAFGKLNGEERDRYDRLGEQIGELADAHRRLIRQVAEEIGPVTGSTVGRMVSQRFEERRDGTYSVEEWVYRTSDGAVITSHKQWLKYPKRGG